jgi:NADH-quinone oxidoreductase subunit N
MAIADILVLLPFIIITSTAVIALLVISVYRNHLLTASLTMIGLVVAFVSLPALFPVLPRPVTSLFIVDGFAFFFAGLIFAAALVTCFFSYGYLKMKYGMHEEFYLLLLLATLGSVVLVASSHFISLFLGLETLSVSLYALISYHRRDDRSVEAGIKYLVLAAASSAFLVFGMALVYADQGTMDFGRLVAQGSYGGTGGVVMLAGTALMIAGLGFKLAVVPFHMWTPDVFEGAPAPVTAFIATVSKGGVFALLLRYFGTPDISLAGGLFMIIAAIAAASMIAGNVLALFQDNIKRILAYSSIAHLGYLLVAFLASGDFAVTAVTFYLIAYFVTMLGAFGVIIYLSDGEGDADHVEQYRSLAWRKPWIALVFTAMLLSLAGIPLTAGFIGKFYVLAAGVRSALWMLVIILVAGSATGLYYYMRIILAMFSRTKAGNKNGIQHIASGSRMVGAMLIVLVLILIWLGTYPGPVISMIVKTVNVMK